MAEALHLELLGGLHLSYDRAPVEGFISSKAPALLCYLAVTGRPHFRSVLAELLWGDLPESDGATNLRQVLANLRRLLGPHLIITRQTVAFNRERCYHLDVEHFEAHLAAGLPAGDPRHLRAAAELYRGDFLRGFAVRDAPAFEEWMLGEEQRLRERVGEALQVLAARHCAEGELATAIDDYRRLLALDPWREEVHRQLMLLYARHGQRGAALAQYRKCRRILEVELGVEPAEETTALFHRILATEKASQHNLAPRATPV